MQRSPDNTITDSAKPLGRRSSDDREPSLSLFPKPYQHLKTMFGLAVVASLTMLLSLPIYFSGSTDVDTQSHRQAQYRVDINCPRWAEFANLPAIGEKTAKAIVEHGQAIGGFRSVDQLLEVKGVGAKTLAKIQPFLVFTNNEQTAQQPQQRETTTNLLSAD